MESTKVSTYRRIVSSTAFFGVAQVLNMVINVVRGKLVAKILHSAGMGVSSILTNASQGIQQLALMGLNISAVRNISQASESGNVQALDDTVRIVRRLVLMASLLGMVLTIALSPVLSQLSFGNSLFIRHFMLLSIAVFFGVMGVGEMTILQGLRRYKLLAFCSVVPPLCGLMLSIPIYYLWGIRGIVPAMILLALIYYMVMRHFSYRYKTAKEPLPLRTVWSKGQDIIQFGIVMTFCIFVGTLTTYALMAFISNMGSISDVGFYQVANTITSQCIGLVFSAMLTDYYPHLSSLVNADKHKAFKLVDQQTEIVLLAVTPLVTMIILLAPVLIRVLLTDEFQAIRSLVRYIALANIFKAFCFPMDYIAYAKGDKKYLFWLETIWSNAKTFLVMSIFYYKMGVDGLGYGAVCSAIIDVVVCVFFIRWRYGFRLTKASVRLLTIMVVLSASCLLCSYIPSATWSYTCMGLLSAVCIVFNIRELDRRMDLRSVLARFKTKFSRRAEAESTAQQ